jgi:hypothetical protein
MSDGTFIVGIETKPTENLEKTSSLEARLRALLAKTRKLIGEELQVTKTLCIPGILDEPTPVTVNFEADPKNQLEAFVTFQNANTDYQIFYIPRAWTGITPGGQITLSTAETILENLNLALEYKYIIPLHELDAETSLGDDQTAHAGIGYEHTKIAGY